MKQDTRSPEAKAAHETFEEFAWKPRMQSPRYVTQAEYDALCKAGLKEGRYLITDPKNPFPENEGT